MVNQVAQLARFCDAARQPSSPSTQGGWGRVRFGSLPWLFNLVHHPGKPDGVPVSPGLRPWAVLARPFGAAILLCALLLRATPATAQGDDYTPGATAGANITSKPDAQVPLDLQFTDESGQTVKLGDYFHPNRPVLLVMVYFGCPQLVQPDLERRERGRAEDRLAARPGFRDHHRQLQSQRGTGVGRGKKGQLHQVVGQARGRRRHGTSSPAAIRPPPETLGDAIGFGYRLDPETGQYLHEAGIYLCTPEGRVSRVERGVLASRRKCSAIR